MDSKQHYPGAVLVEVDTRCHRLKFSEDENRMRTI
jgi:hypothetical protein